MNFWLIYLHFVWLKKMIYHCKLMNFEILSDDVSKVSLKISWTYPQIVASDDHARHNFKINGLYMLKTIFISVFSEKQIHVNCFGLLYNKSLDIITHSKCMHNKLSPTSDHCHSRAKEGVRAQLDRVRNSEVYIRRLECTVVLQDFYLCTIFV